MNSSGNHAQSGSRNRRSGILFLALIQTCLLASGAHAQLSYIDQYASGTVEGMDCSGGPSSCQQGTFFSASMPASIPAGLNYQSPGSDQIQFGTMYGTGAFNLELTHAVPHPPSSITIFDARSNVNAVFDLAVPTQIHLEGGTQGFMAGESDLTLFCVAATNCSSTMLYDQVLDAGGISASIGVEAGRYRVGISHSMGSWGDGSIVAMISVGAAPVPALGPIGTLLLVAMGGLTLGHAARRRSG